MSTSPDFAKQLRKQLGFLERSAVMYDGGEKDEAFRIATALRVTFHQTRNSTSLLTHLGSPSVLIRSTAPDNSRDLARLGGRKVVGQFLISLVTIKASSRGSVILPKTEVADHHRMIPWEHWWKETFASINNQDYTRRALVLWACNQDGGAHVDDQLEPEYEAIKASGAIGSFVYNGQTIPIEDAHLVFLRSMAFEVLSSPNIRALAGL